MKKIKQGKYMYEKHDTAVLFDIENIQEVDDLKKIIKLLNEDILKNERPLFNTAYTDWSIHGMEEKRALLISNGTIPNQVLSYGSKLQKNASDIALCIDATELLMDSEIKRFVVVTGDGGFLSLITKLKKHKKEVVVISTSENFASVIRNFADKVYLVGETAKGEIRREADLYEEDKDIIGAESSKNYFKAIWALSKNHVNLAEALYKIFNKYSVSVETRKSGLKYIILETILRYSKHDISEIKQSLYEFLMINNQDLMLVMSEEKEILIMHRYAKNFPKRFKEISLEELLSHETQIAS
jgi:uncharacterized LabA/DUF88 family protein